MLRISSEPHRTLFGKTIKHPHDFFSAIDSDGSGTVEADEMIDAFKRMDVGLSTEEVAWLLENMDEDGNEKLSYLEFLNELNKFGTNGTAWAEGSQHLRTSSISGGMYDSHSLFGKGLVSVAASISRSQAEATKSRRKRPYETRILLFDDALFDGELGLVFGGVRHPLSLLRPELSDACAVMCVEPNTLAAKTYPTWAAAEPVSLDADLAASALRVRRACAP